VSPRRRPQRRQLSPSSYLEGERTFPGLRAAPRRRIADRRLAAGTYELDARSLKHLLEKLRRLDAHSGGVETDLDFHVAIAIATQNRSSRC